MLLHETVRSSTLKLAMVYIVLFCAAIFGLLGYVYWSSVTYLERNLDRALLTEGEDFVQAYEKRGRDGVVALIGERHAGAGPGGWYYELADSASRPIAGNVGAWPGPLHQVSRPQPGWGPVVYLELPSARGGTLPVRAAYRTLSDGDHLLIAERLDHLDALSRELRITLIAAALLFLILAAAAGVSTARRSVTRIEAINATSRKIMRSGFGERIPLRGTGDEWDELANNLNSMLSRIEQLVETNRQVSDNIAHDLRTPLMRIRGRLERAAAHEPDRNGYRILVSRTIDELDDVLKTFSSLLRISRIEASEHMAHASPLDLARLASDVVELFDATAEEHSVGLVYECDETLPVFGDRDLLFDAIANVVDNAIKHGGSGGKVLVSARRGSAGPILEVSDRGAGIPVDERHNIFRRFYRLEQSRNRPGNGLGLSLVAAVAALHNVHIEVTDNAPGLKIKLFFPAAAVVADDKIISSAPTGLSSRDAPSARLNAPG